MADEGEAPKPGHFLPGGAGAESGGPQPEQRKVIPSGLGQPRSLEPRTEQQGWQAARGAGPQQPPQLPRPPRDGRKALIAGIVAGGLVALGGIVFASSKVISTFDGLTDDPFAAQSPVPSVSTVAPAPTDSTVTVTATPPSYEAILKQNKLYRAGRLNASCKEPSYRPTSPEKVALYVQALAKCLDNAWAPAVRRAGYEFHPAVTFVFDEGEDICGETVKDPFYCDNGYTINLPWKSFVDQYHRSQSGARADLLETTSTLYGYHVMELAGIFDAQVDLSDSAPNETVAKEWERRFSLSGECLGGAYVAANKAAFPLRGRLLDQWTYIIEHAGKDRERRHGSPKNAALWAKRGYTAGHPGVCNTWVAPPREVS